MYNANITCMHASTPDRVDACIQKNQEYKAKLERLKKGLMQKLLTGQIRVKVWFCHAFEMIEYEKHIALNHSKWRYIGNLWCDTKTKQQIHKNWVWVVQLYKRYIYHGQEHNQLQVLRQPFGKACRRQSYSFWQIPFNSRWAATNYHQTYSKVSGEKGCQSFAWHHDNTPAHQWQANTWIRRCCPQWYHAVDCVG